MRRCPLFLFLIMWFMPINLVWAQLRQTTLFLNDDFATKVYFQSWSKSNDRIRQLSIPVIYILPVNRKLTIDVTTGLAFAQRTTASNRLDGLVDTRVRASYMIFDEKLLLSTFLTVPTGVSRLEGDQNEVAAALSDDALDFQIPNYGHGLHFNVAAVYAQEIRRGFVIGTGVAFLFKDAFKPFESRDLEYRPGNEVTLTFGIDIGGTKFKFAGDVAYISYQADKANDQEVFKSGNKLFLYFRWILKPQPFGLTIFLMNRSKGKNERGIGLLEEEILNSNGNQLDIGSHSFYRLNNKTILKGYFGTKIYSKNEYGDRGALIFGVGGGLEHHFSRRVSLDVTFRFSKGSLKSGTNSIGVTGVEFGGGIRYRL